MVDGEHSHNFRCFTGDVFFIIHTFGFKISLDSIITKELCLQNDLGNNQDSILEKAAATATNTNAANHKQGEDIMSVLLAHEKKGGVNATAVKAVLPQESSDSSDNEDAGDMQAVDTGKRNEYLLNKFTPVCIKIKIFISGEVDVMESDDEDQSPTVMVNGKSVSLTDVNDALIAEMTASEKEAYIQIYQDYYSSMYD